MKGMIRVMIQQILNCTSGAAAVLVGAVHKGKLINVHTFTNGHEL